MTRDDTIEAALVKVAASVGQVAPGRWTFAITNGTATAATARVDGEWLVFDARPPLAPAGVPDPWAMLAWNAALDGGARFAMRAGPAGPEVRADVALAPDVDPTRRIIEAYAGLQTAAICLHDPADLAATSTPTSIAAADGAEALAALCRETRWSVAQRDAGSLVVDLDVPGAVHQARVERRADGRVAVSVPVFDPTATRDEPASEACRHALGVFLVRTCGSIRMIRAATDAGGSPRFELVQAAPSLVELEHGFAALSVACRFAAREAAVLWHDDVVANAYVRRWDDGAGRRAA